MPLSNPFSLTSAAKFTAFFAVVLMLVALTRHYYEGQGLLLVAALAGLTDVDAITLSMADYARIGEADLAAQAIVVAALANTVVKVGMVVVLGGAAVRRRVLTAGIAIVAIGSAALFLL